MLKLNRKPTDLGLKSPVGPIDEKPVSIIHTLQNTRKTTGTLNMNKNCTYHAYTSKITLTNHLKHIQQLTQDAFL